MPQTAQEWVDQHWTHGCPFCGSPNPRWAVSMQADLATDWKPPSGSQAKYVVSVVPVTCKNCLVSAFLTVPPGGWGP
jgi:hypothetical protein